MRGTPRRPCPQDTTPNIAFYEANCPEFVIASTQLGCGDYRPLGGPYCDGVASTPTIPSCINQPGDLTGTVYGADRAGGSISWVARDSADHGTIWAATSAGRVFVTHNGDASDPATVTWHRIDNADARRPGSRAGSTSTRRTRATRGSRYSGYNASTPTTPGHVFEVTRERPARLRLGHFTNLNVESGTSAFPTPIDDGDLPVADVVRDDADAHAVRRRRTSASCRGANDGHGGWHTTQGMPRYEVMHLEIQPSSRVADVHGRRQVRARPLRGDALAGHLEPRPRSGQRMTTSR